MKQLKASRIDEYLYLIENEEGKFDRFHNREQIAKKYSHNLFNILEKDGRYVSPYYSPSEYTLNFNEE